jgi:hypothetical protein
MAMSVSSSAVRAALAAAILTAWGTQKTYFSASPLAMTDLDFTGITDTETAARAYVLLDEWEALPVEGQAGFGQSELRFAFRIQGIFKAPEPGSGDVLQDVKEANTDALIAELSASPTFASGRREMLRGRYNVAAEEELARAYFKVEIDFQWRGTTGT